MTHGIQRVLMTADTVGGVWTYALDLSRALARHGVEIHLATMGAPVSTSQALEAAGIDGLEVHESSYRLEWMEDPWTDLERASDWLLTLENETQPDVVHLNGYVHGSLPWSAPHLVVGHSCVLSWWNAVRAAPAPATWDRYRQAVTAGLRSADFVVAPSRAMMSELLRFYGPFHSTAVIPNARHRRAYSAGAKEPLVLAAGRVWDEAKNIAVLGRMNQFRDWPLYVAGDPSHPDGSQTKIGDVQMLGRLSAAELAGWYRRAAIYCLPALYEPFGLSVLEAALSGCALLLGDIPSLRENWNGAADFVPPRDPEAIASSLRELAGNECRRQALAAAACRRASSFDPDSMASAYLEVYGKLAGSRVPSAVVWEGL